MDNITCYLSGVQDQTWQPMNSLLMDGQEERQKKRFSTVGPFWSCGVFFPQLLECVQFQWTSMKVSLVGHNSKVVLKSMLLSFPVLST